MSTGERRLVSSGSPWEEPVRCSRAVRVGPLAFVAGTTAALPDGGALSGDDVYEQAREALRRIADALHEAGARIEDDAVVPTARWPTRGRRR